MLFVNIGASNVQAAVFILNISPSFFPMHVVQQRQQSHFMYKQ
jgi:hypothetical protein